MIKRINRICSFLRNNKNKALSFQVLFLSGLYRFLILLVPMKYLKPFMGIQNEESPQEELLQNYKEAAKISHVVNRVCNQTGWESKCLVRALTAKYLLKKRKISSTLYLGVGKENEEMIAHAWLRCGRYYITGGNGEGYAIVAKFRT